MIRVKVKFILVKKKKNMTRLLTLYASQE